MVKSGFNVRMTDFAADIEAVRRESRRSAEEMLKYTMILMLTAGRSATPLGKKNRPLEHVGAIDTYAGGTFADEDAVAENDKMRGAAYYTVYHQGMAPQRKYLPRIPRASKRIGSFERVRIVNARKAIIRRFREIEYRGAARQSWGWALFLITGTNPTLSVGAGASETNRQRRRSEPVELFKQFGGPSPYIEVVNKLGWIEKIAPGIVQTMINSADRRLEAWLEKRWQSGLDVADRNRRSGAGDIHVNNRAA